MRYFLLIPADWFHDRLAPSLGDCWRARSFAPAIDICRELTASAQTFVQQRNEEATDPLTLRVPDGLRFRPELWRILAGELMLFSAVELPEIETPLESMAALLHQPLAEARGQFSPIQQAVSGSRDLWFGRWYRPDHAGWNDCRDMARLVSWLGSVDPESWQPGDLSSLPPEDREEELAFVREWFPAVRDMYNQADAEQRVIVSEIM